MPQEFRRDGAIATLTAYIGAGRLTGKSQEIAQDLVTASTTRRGGLSDAQWGLVERLIKQVEAPAAQSPAGPEPEDLGSRFGGVFELFEQAVQNGIKHPKIRLATGDGQALMFVRAGSGSRYSGQIMITDGGRYPNNRYFGRIDDAGRFVGGRDLTPSVASYLRAFNANPADLARVYGQKTGQCAFCGLELKDGRSIHHGYGPICADRWGLPYGDVPDGEEVFDQADLFAQ